MQTTDARVCRLTGKVYDMNWGVDFAHEKRPVHMNGLTVVKKHIRQSNVARLEVAIRGALRTPTPSPSPITPFDEVHQQFHTLVQSMLPALPIAHRDAVVTTVKDVYLRIRLAAGALSRQYTPELHTVVVLYYMATGGRRHGSVPFVQPNPHVQEALPSVDVLWRRIHNQRTALKMFDEYMQKCI